MKTKEYLDCASDSKSKDSKHIPGSTWLQTRFLSFPGIPLYSQEIFGIDVLTALKSSLEQCGKHVLRLLQPYGDQALSPVVNRNGRKDGGQH